MPAGSPTPRTRTPRVTPPPVTPDGLREGDPLVLAALVTRRGGDVLAYANEVAPPGTALRMAAAVFVEFRVAVLSTHDPDFDPAAELLSATRRIAARQAENPFRPGDHRRPATRTTICDRFPRLLTAWADHRLPREDAVRLREHVVDCPDCDALNIAFDRAETAFRDGPPAELAPEETGGLVAAMALASTG
ncbi:zf-HC2 domain-containing protein [Patulibacter sp. NPDC049589]|uniref:zf-HC2 domain-containing protein n=1 Tax=Patulibacter sp. NPDC049589 TaxID=3154731 RepID=UPI0034149A59